MHKFATLGPPGLGPPTATMSAAVMLLGRSLLGAPLRRAAPAAAAACSRGLFSSSCVLRSQPETAPGAASIDKMLAPPSDDMSVGDQVRWAALIFNCKPSFSMGMRV